MASTFAELYSDFLDQAKVYTEKLDVTELSFMRMFTRGMQIFQRESLYVERTVVLNRQNVNGQNVFIVPQDMLLIKDVRNLIDDGNGRFTEEIFLLQEFGQFNRNKDKWERGYLETPTDYGMRIPHKRSVSDGRGSQVRMCTIWQRELITYPEFEGDRLWLWYYPDIHAISQNSPQWTAWFPYDPNFMNMFRTSSVTDVLKPFERAFLEYALSDFIRSKGSANYAVYQKNFESEIQRAIETKPTYYREGVASYMFAPYS